VAAHLLIREYYTCFNERRFADAAELFASDAVIERPIFGTLKNGGDGYLQLVDVWVSAFPDSQARIEHVEQRGDTICEVGLVLTGTHLGNLNLPNHGTFTPTRQLVTLEVDELLEIRARKITYSSARFDVDDLVRQVTPKG